MNPVYKVGKIKLELLPEKAALWRDGQTIFLADVHFGKDALWRSSGQYVPEVGLSDLKRLSVLIKKYAATHVVIVGDLIHSKATKDFKALSEFFSTQPQKFTLVVGNHDQWGINELELMELDLVPRLQIEEVMIVHDRGEVTTGRFISGHEHPGVRIPTEGVFPAFVAIAEGLVLPAFGSFTGSMRVSKTNSDKAWVIGEGEVVKLW